MSFLSGLHISEVDVEYFPRQFIIPKHLSQYMQFLWLLFYPFLEITSPKMVFWCTSNNMHFYLVLQFLTRISTLLVSGFCHGFCCQYHIKQLKCLLQNQKPLAGLKISSIFCWICPLLAPCQKVI